MALSLDSLSTELTELIADNLHPKELLNLRLASKRIYQKILLSTASRLFTTVSTDLSRTSLERIEQWWSRSELRQHVTTMQFSLNSVSPGASAEDYWYTWKGTEKDYVCHDNPGVLKLQDILVNILPNCRIFEVHPDSVGQDVRYDDEMAVTDLDCLVALFIAALHNRIPIKELHVPNPSELSSESFSMSRAEDALDFLEQHKFDETVWSSLEALTMMFAYSWEYDKWAATLVSKATNLKSIQLGNLCDQDCENIFKALEFPRRRRLQTIGLDKLTIFDRHFSPVLENCCACLESLDISGVLVNDGSVRGMLTGWPSRLPRLKKFVFKDLPEFPDVAAFLKSPEIASMHPIRYLGREYEIGYDYPIALGIEYSGPDAAQVLDQVLPTIIHINSPGC